MYSALSARAARLHVSCGSHVDAIVEYVLAEVAAVAGRLACLAILHRPRSPPMLTARYDVPVAGFVLRVAWALDALPGTDARRVWTVGETGSAEQVGDIVLGRSAKAPARSARVRAFGRLRVARRARTFSFDLCDTARCSRRSKNAWRATRRMAQEFALPVRVARSGMVATTDSPAGWHLRTTSARQRGTVLRGFRLRDV
jgi:hypothetical protein